jgi:hypothetical protein
MSEITPRTLPRIPSAPIADTVPAAAELMCKGRKVFKTDRGAVVARCTEMTNHDGKHYDDVFLIDWDRDALGG